MNLLRNLPPQYDDSLSLEESFWRFFDWGVNLPDPLTKIVDIGLETTGIKSVRHPLGFVAVYLSPKAEGFRHESSGHIRANVFSPGCPVENDIHSHGFRFFSGVAEGELINTRHFPDFDLLAESEEGYVGYVNRVDQFTGKNHTSELPEAEGIVIARSEVEILGSGDMYTMNPRDDFHSLEIPLDGPGLVTIFAKEPAMFGAAGDSLTLRLPEDPPPPRQY